MLEPVEKQLPFANSLRLASIYEATFAASVPPVFWAPFFGFWPIIFVVRVRSLSVFYPDGFLHQNTSNDRQIRKLRNSSRRRVK
jgi:hypothetical protein